MRACGRFRSYLIGVYHAAWWVVEVNRCLGMARGWIISSWWLCPAQSDCGIPRTSSTPDHLGSRLMFATTCLYCDVRGGGSVMQKDWCWSKRQKKQNRERTHVSYNFIKTLTCIFMYTGLRVLGIFRIGSSKKRTTQVGIFTYRERPCLSYNTAGACRLSKLSVRFICNMLKLMTYYVGRQNSTTHITADTMRYEYYNKRWF